MKEFQKNLWLVVAVLVIAVAGFYFYKTTRQSSEQVTNDAKPVAITDTQQPRERVIPDTILVPGVNVPTAPASVSEPVAGSVYKIGENMIIRWTGTAKPNDLCSVTLEGPYGDDRKLIKDQEIIVPIGYPPCGLGQMSWLINDSRIKPNLMYKVVITNSENQHPANEPFVIILPTN